jgi:hypothetical protein
MWKPWTHKADCTSKYHVSRAWLHTIITTLWGQRQKDLEFKASLGYIAKLSHKIKKRTNNSKKKKYTVSTFNLICQKKIFFKLREETPILLLQTYVCNSKGLGPVWVQYPRATEVSPSPASSQCCPKKEKFDHSTGLPGTPLVYHDMESITHVFHGCNRLLEFAKSK